MLCASEAIAQSCCAREAKSLTSDVVHCQVRLWHRLGGFQGVSRISTSEKVQK